MSFNSILSNFFRSILGTFSQFNFDDNLISEQTQQILSDTDARKELSQKLHDSKKNGDTKIEIQFKDKKVEFLVES